MDHAVTQGDAVPRRAGEPYRSIFLRWWFPHTVMLAMSAGILGLAAAMHTTEAWVYLFGYKIPILCGFRQLTGYPCPGCGMTRSFVFLAHGHVLEAFKLNPMGPFLFLFFLVQPPYRLVRLVQGARRHA